MEGINVVMPVENEMARPDHFLGCPGILNVTMIFVALLYGVVGMMGYLRFGEDVQGNVVLNLPEEDILALVAKVLVILAVFFTYCLQMYAPMEIIWDSFRDRIAKKYHNIAEILVRTSFVTLTGKSIHFDTLRV
ncbi:Proton-coupled amino acid transporter-like protein pathetic [Eumeta japonica]|uniref:Proton-coupled amino acid transporter-like protein pathetic n=1 Tax=Eumeta variegata TaxID=151549 RepID=A0A4C1WP47_EUMVA|nr:Proton-coupled amino acid transporter-like protein pathetic [Eumeta japonica]